MLNLVRTSGLLANMLHQFYNLRFSSCIGPWNFDIKVWILLNKLVVCLTPLSSSTNDPTRRSQLENGVTESGESSPMKVSIISRHLLACCSKMCIMIFCKKSMQFMPLWHIHWHMPRQLEHKSVRKSQVIVEKAMQCIRICHDSVCGWNRHRGVPFPRWVESEQAS